MTIPFSFIRFLIVDGLYFIKKKLIKICVRIVYMELKSKLNLAIILKKSDFFLNASIKSVQK